MRDKKERIQIVNEAKVTIEVYAAENKILTRRELDMDQQETKGKRQVKPRRIEMA
jgi:hypothetical protein